MTSYNTGASAAAFGPDPSQAITIPDGVLEGDVMLLVTEAFTVSGTEATLSVSSTGTAFTQIGETVFTTTGTLSIQAAIWYAIAGSSDAGKVITASSTVSAYWAVAMASYTGANTSTPIDVNGGVAQVSVTSLDTPDETTGQSGDWAVYLGIGAVNSGATITGPADTTERQSIVSGSGIGAAIYDSNGSVGNSGTSIGGGSYSGNNGSGYLAVFTIGLAPAMTDVTATVAIQMAPMATVSETKETFSARAAAKMTPMAVASEAAVTNWAFWMPVYIYPSPDTDWDTLIDGAPTVRYLVADPDSGPGTSPDSNYMAVIEAAQAAGVTILGYIDTDYGAVELATVQTNVGLWNSLYGVTDIFFDRVSSDSGDLSYYTTACGYVTGVTALNHGGIPDEGYASIGTVLFVFENDVTAWPAFAPPSWFASYPPNKFGINVYDVATDADMETIIGQAASYGIGNFFVTDEDDDDFDALPTYLSGELDYIQGLNGGNVTATVAITMSVMQVRIEQVGPAFTSGFIPFVSPPGWLSGGFRSFTQGS